MIQQGVSTGGVALSGSNSPAGDVMTIGRIMDWIEARMEAVKAREEEEDEDEEREKEKEKARGSVPTSHNDANKGSSARAVFPADTARNQSTSPRVDNHAVRSLNLICTMTNYLPFVRLFRCP